MRLRSAPRCSNRPDRIPTGRWVTGVHRPARNSPPRYPGRPGSRGPWRAARPARQRPPPGCRRSAPRSSSWPPGRRWSAPTGWPAAARRWSHGTGRSPPTAPARRWRSSRSRCARWSPARRSRTPGRPRSSPPPPGRGTTCRSWRARCGPDRRLAGGRYPPGAGPGGRPHTVPTTRSSLPTSHADPTPRVRGGGQIHLRMVGPVLIR